MANLSTCLWFDGQAEEAASFYVRVFAEGGRSAKIGRIARYGESAAKASGQPEGTVLTVEFELDGNKFLGLNGGPIFKFSPATSFVVNCETQEEIDYFWARLAEGGKEGQCGWIDYDKFGVSWQIVPRQLLEMISNKDRPKADRAFQAMMGMQKLDLAKLQTAFDGV